jgi:hypothetical protein
MQGRKNFRRMIPVILEAEQARKSKGEALKADADAKQATRYAWDHEKKL